jgi:hypothetical protein
MRPGSGRDVTSLYFGGDPDIGFYTASDLERRIKRKHFADYPEQKGDTPPTATQWADEMLKAQRRIGTPGKKFWREGPYAIYRRFEWLLQKDGKISDITINSKKLSLIANNPATQAADNQKVQVGGNLLSMAKTYFPETSAAAIDERATIDNFKKLMKDEVVVLRNETQTKDLLNTVLGAAQQAGAVPADQAKEANKRWLPSRSSVTRSAALLRRAAACRSPTASSSGRSRSRSRDEPEAHRCRCHPVRG